jgi:hypothetical protein
MTCRVFINRGQVDDLPLLIVEVKSTTCLC